jgi:hypothetical protein
MMDGTALSLEPAFLQHRIIVITALHALMKKWNDF